MVKKLISYRFHGLNSKNKANSTTVFANSTVIEDSNDIENFKIRRSETQTKQRGSKRQELSKKQIISVRPYDQQCQMQSIIDAYEYDDENILPQEETYLWSREVRHKDYLVQVIHAEGKRYKEEQNRQNEHRATDGILENAIAEQMLDNKRIGKPNMETILQSRQHEIIKSMQKKASRQNAIQFGALSGKAMQQVQQKSMENQEEQIKETTKQKILEERKEREQTKNYFKDRYDTNKQRILHKLYCMKANFNEAVEKSRIKKEKEKEEKKKIAAEKHMAELNQIKEKKIKKVKDRIDTAEFYPTIEASASQSQLADCDLPPASIPFEKNYELWLQQQNDINVAIPPPNIPPAALKYYGRK